MTMFTNMAVNLVKLYTSFVIVFGQNATFCFSELHFTLVTHMAGVCRKHIAKIWQTVS